MGIMDMDIGFISLNLTNGGGVRLLTEATSGPGTGQPSVTLSYGYDPSGDVTSISDSLSGTTYSGHGLTTFVYDNALRLTTISQSFGGTAGPLVTMAYDSGGLVTATNRTVGSSATVGSPTNYDAQNRVTSIQIEANTPIGQALVNVEDISYTYDSAGRVTSETDKEGTASFTYDNAGQLTAVSGSRTESFGYDSGGNRDTTGYSTGSGNEMTSGGGYTYTYDNVGNMTSKTQTSNGNVWNYAYDYDNRMTAAVEKSSGGTTLAQVTYTYDAPGPADRG